MNKSDVTKAMLEGLVLKFNMNIVSKEQPLPTGKKRGETKDKVEAELIGAANELLQPGDEQFFDDSDIDLMTTIGIDFVGLTGVPGGSGSLISDSASPSEAPNDEPVVEEPVVEVKEKKAPAVATERSAKDKSASKRKVKTEDLIAAGKYTRAEIVEKILAEFAVSKSTIGTVLSDGKNPKYNKFEKLVVEDKTTGILSFEK